MRGGEFVRVACQLYKLQQFHRAGTTFTHGIRAAKTYGQHDIFNHRDHREL